MQINVKEQISLFSLVDRGIIHFFLLRGDLKATKLIHKSRVKIISFLSKLLAMRVCVNEYE